MSRFFGRIGRIHALIVYNSLKDCHKSVITMSDIKTVFYIPKMSKIYTNVEIWVKFFAISATLERMSNDICLSLKCRKDYSKSFYDTDWVSDKTFSHKCFAWIRFSTEIRIKFHKNERFMLKENQNGLRIQYFEYIIHRTLKSDIRWWF